MNIVWSFVFEALLGTQFNVKIGETSCSLKNSKKKLESTEARISYTMGSHIDLLYCWNGIELGGTEFGKQQSSITTDKYLDDGSVKLPKVLKDMICTAVEARRGLTNEEQTLMLDIPAGKVCRLSRTSIFNFPNSPANNVDGLKPLFQMVWKAKEIMKKTQEVLQTGSSDIEVDLITSLPQPSLPLCFERSKDVSEKRKIETL